MAEKMILNKDGFTLVELAIALMVIGLLIGGVLKGQELIENARHTQFIRQHKAYETAVTIFRTTYNALPGDMRNPSRRLPNCNADPCQLTGTGNDQIAGNNERVNYWIHMEKAGLITGSNENALIDQPTRPHGVASPPNPFGRHTIIRYESTMNPPDPIAKNRYYMTDDRGEDVEQVRISSDRLMILDQKMDDGKPLTGEVQFYSGTAVSGNLCHDGENYVRDVTRCVAFIEAYGAN